MKRIFILSILATMAALSCRKEAPSNPPALFRLKLSSNDVVVTDSSIKVSWPMYINHEDYELIITDSTSAATPKTLCDTVRTAERQYTFYHLASSTSYRIRIRALNHTYGICSEYTAWPLITTE